MFNTSTLPEALPKLCVNGNRIQLKIILISEFCFQK